MFPGSATVSTDLLMQLLLKGMPAALLRVMFNKLTTSIALPASLLTTSESSLGKKSLFFCQVTSRLKEAWCKSYSPWDQSKTNAQSLNQKQNRKFNTELLNCFSISKLRTILTNNYSIIMITLTTSNNNCNKRINQFLYSSFHNKWRQMAASDL